MVKLHPLAGKCGEGPPLAPDLWRWRAGNRLSDMYFTSPTGEKFRSRPELNVYLSTLANPPSTDCFQWRVTEEFLAKNQVACWDAKTQRRHSGEEISEKEDGEGSSEKKTEKRKEVTKDTPYKERKKLKLKSPSPSQQPSIMEDNPSPSPQRVSYRRQIPEVAGVFSTPPAKPRPKQKATKTDKIDKRWGHDEFFTHVLSSEVSWKWLYDSQAATKFLAQAENLKEKSESDMADLRNILLNRNSDMSSIAMYSNQVLGIFVQILRNVRPPSTMGKVQLADLVVNWKCKKRHFWCLLETDRLAPYHPSSPKVDAASVWAGDDRMTMLQATDATCKGSIRAPEDRRNFANIGGNSAKGESGSGFEEPDTTSNEDLQLEVTLRDIQEDVKNIMTEHPADQLDLNVTSDDTSQQSLKSIEESGHLSDFENTPMGNANRRMKSSEVTPRPEQGVLPSQSVYDVQYNIPESIVILDRIKKNTHVHLTTYDQEDQTIKQARCSETVGPSSANVSGGVGHRPQSPQITSFPRSYQFPNDSSICWCKTCLKDQAFCRGCMCCLCPDPVKPEDDWMALRCNCRHICHVECALENKLAGVVKDLNMDGELSCPSCSHRMDLWPFFQRSFDRLCGAESKSNSTDLETLVILVLRLLDGTENRKYTLFRKLVVELHDLMKKFSIQTLVQQVLVEIKNELYEPLLPDSDATKVVEDSMEAATRKRGEIETSFNNLAKAYQILIDQTRQVRAAQASNNSNRNIVEQSEKVGAKVFSSPLTEQIENQETQAEEEFVKLVQSKPSTVKPNNPTLAGIDSSVNTWLDAVRAQRRAVEAAETELHLLKTSQKQCNEI